MRAPSGIVSWSVSTPKDGMAMITRMMIGSTVQTISISVLWVKRAGTGLALALKRTMTTTSSASTSSDDRR